MSCWSLIGHSVDDLTLYRVPPLHCGGKAPCDTTTPYGLRLISMRESAGLLNRATGRYLLARLTIGDSDGLGSHRTAKVGESVR
jgi:hypothetical protein